jgi:hypothetical protein
MSKQTAVEWLVNEITVIDWTDPYWKLKLEQSKEMEKAQICTSYVYGAAYGIDTTNDFKPEIYYKETYGSNND